jgi:hypothetical protein
MLKLVCGISALLVSVPAWAQVVPSATGGPEDYTPMRIPPPVSIEAYPTVTGAQMRSNYLSARLNVITAYDDNLLTGAETLPVSDTIYTVNTSIGLDKATPRLRQKWFYSPGFTFYQHTSSLNAADQNVSVDCQYRMSPHTAVSVLDFFQKSSNVFNQSEVGVAGSIPSSPAEVVAPFTNRMGNTARAELSDQFSSRAMIGVSGTSSVFNYDNPGGATGLANSNSRGGSAFYNRRFSGTHYLGVTYQYLWMLSTSNLGDSTTQTHTVSIFYTFYWQNSLTLSLSGGPQHYDVVQSPLPVEDSWEPAFNASLSWQREHTNLVISYSKTVEGTGGLVGAFHSENASANARWQMTRDWTAAMAASYELHKNVNPLSSSNPGGHSVSGTATLRRTLGKRWSAELGYVRLHQSYNGISLISNAPDSNRESVSVSYEFSRPLGR